MASKEDDIFAKWNLTGFPQEQIDNAARGFFKELLGDGTRCPNHFHEYDWQALQVFRQQWIRDEV